MAAESSTASADLVLLHHLPDSTALLADDVAMQLVRHLDVLRYGHQRLTEEAVTGRVEIKKRHIR